MGRLREKGQTTPSTNQRTALGTLLETRQPGPVHSNNQSKLRKEHRNPPTVRSTTKFKTEGPRKITPSLGKNL
jgi:hypothetical protein